MKAVDDKGLGEFFKDPCQAGRCFWRSSINMWQVYLKKPFDWRYSWFGEYILLASALLNIMKTKYKRLKAKDKRLVEDIYEKALHEAKLGMAQITEEQY